MSHLLIFVGKTSDSAEDVLKNVKESSKKFKGKVCENFGIAIQSVILEFIF